ncbi:Discolored-paralog2 [Zea mays]|uniref:Discolored-paralog2 n=1 Tax=Zea mays TaxID=4577 RepID=A0A1D6KKF7_MAIZE|nr:Discolored-paralog2 [Zea mays]
MYFAKLDDSPMFRTQIQSLEESAELLRERCLKFHKGCRKYTEGLGEAYDGDIAFASSLETFGGGHNDPMSVAFGGPVMTKFTIALREIGTYKEVLRSQVEHMLNDRLLNFVDIDLHDVKDAHKRFDKASLSYDQVSYLIMLFLVCDIREKYLSLKKAFDNNQELHSARSSFEQARFNLVTSLSHVEAKKRFEFLEAVSATMDSHLRYFKQGYELLHQMEPYINQVTFKHFLCIMLLMLCSCITSIYTDDDLDYYKKIIGLGYPHAGCSMQRNVNPPEHGSGLLSRLFSSHYHIHDEKSVARHTVNLLTSTIKVDAEQSDLRFCFRIISPTKIYTLQAESAVDQMDWIEKITGVIASLLSSQSPEQCFMSSPKGSGHDRSTSDGSSFTSSVEFEPSVIDDLVLEKYSGNGQHDVIRGTHHHRTSMKPEKPIDLLRKVDGNNMCADCGALEPDWASLNLGALLCIECSGVHRNLGVHISKVRSLTLDVRVWEPSVINLFQSLGNMFVNNIWEDMLPDDNSSADGSDTSQYLSVSKPKHKDVFSAKEKFIHAKYVDKEFIRKRSMDENQLAEQMWNSVAANDKKTAYSLIVRSRANVNLVYGEMPSSPFLTLGKALQQEQPVSPPDGSPKFFDCNSHDKISPREPLSPASTSSRTDDMEDGCEGLSLLHLACRVADVGMVELLLQYGASVNMNDSRGRTPLHHCILKGRHRHAKLLLSRGADSQAMDRDGRTALQYAIDGGTSDEDILALLEDHSR